MGYHFKRIYCPCIFITQVVENFIEAQTIARVYENNKYVFNRVDNKNYTVTY